MSGEITLDECNHNISNFLLNDDLKNAQMWRKIKSMQEFS